MIWIDVSEFRCALLVFFQCDNCEFSVPVVFRSKAQCAGKTQSTRCSQSTRFAHGLGPARGAGPGMPFSRTATRHWSIWDAPFGPARKQPCPKHSLRSWGRPSALLCSLELATASPAVARLAADCFLVGCIHQSLVVRPPASTWIALFRLYFKSFATHYG